MNKELGNENLRNICPPRYKISNKKTSFKENIWDMFCMFLDIVKVL